MDSFFAILEFDRFLVFRDDITYRFNPLFESQDYSAKVLHLYICTMIIWSANLRLKSGWFKLKLSVALNLCLLVAFLLSCFWSVFIVFSLVRSFSFFDNLNMFFAFEKNARYFPVLETL